MIRRRVLIRDEALQIFPIGKVDTTCEAPDTIEYKPAFDIASGAALSWECRSREHITIHSPHVLLRLGVVHADNPVLHREIGKNPRAGAATPSKFRGYLNHHADGHFIATVARRLKQSIEAPVLEVFVNPMCDEAVPLRLECLFAQHRNHGLDSIENCFSTCLRRHSGWGSHDHSPELPV